MQPLNHDMDDLFRKAAAGYPIKTGEDDWEKIAAKLSVAAVGPEIVKRRKSKYVGLLLLVLFLFMILGGIFHKYSPQGGDFKRAGLYKTIIKKEKIVIDQKRNTQLVHADSSTRRSKLFVHKIRKAQRGTKVFSGGFGDFLDGREKVPETQLVDDFINKEVDLSNHELTQYEPANTHVKSAPLLLHYSITGPALNFTTVKISDHQFQRHKGIYLALNGGPEFSQVGSQTITKTGYHAGLLVGYRFNKTFSLESGILFGKNKYYSSGKYFSMSKLAALMPAGMEIVNLIGQSKQLEIPVSIKYDFVIRQQSNLFFTAGILSNIYLQEKNYYQTMLNGVEANEMGLYNKDHYFIASQLTISGGYEHILGKSFRLRIEPYKKIPLRKVGMGSMPVFSSGINVGLVRVLGR